MKSSKPISELRSISVSTLVKYLMGLIFISAIALFHLGEVADYQAANKLLNNNIDELSIQISDLEYSISKLTDLEMVVTAYTASVDECDSTPEWTATMSKPIVNTTVAVSRDKLYMLGKKIYVEGIGVWKVTDIMNARYSNRIDILVKDKKTARKWGKQKRRVVVL